VKRTALWALPSAVLVAAFWYGGFSHQVPAGQPPLAAMDLAALRADFNRAADGARLIVLLSPT
jgi:hypothetical protein